ncbi:MAG: methyl-accepting chemotaxis protein [Planctomycetes bacterium]|nr:methyl-accepting chemotaxis protein [Planctomycetota bacterium]
MNLRARLDRLLWLCLAALAAVSALGIAAGLLTGRQTGILTGSILPQQEDMAKLQDGLHQVGGLVSRQMRARDGDDARAVATATNLAFTTCQEAAGRLHALGVDIPAAELDQVGSGADRAAADVRLRLAASANAQNAANGALAASAKALAATRTMVEAMRQLGDQAHASLEAAQVRSSTASTRIKALISVQDRASQLETLALQVRAAERRSRIQAQRDRVTGHLEVIRNALAAAGLADARLRTGPDAVEAAFLGEKGLLACRAAVVGGGGEAARPAEDAAAAMVATALGELKPVLSEGIDQGELDAAQAGTALTVALKALAATGRVRQAAVAAENGAQGAALVVERLLSAQDRAQVGLQAEAGAKVLAGARQALDTVAAALKELGQAEDASSQAGGAIATLTGALAQVVESQLAAIAAEERALAATTHVLAAIERLDAGVAQRSVALAAVRATAISQTALISRCVPLALLAFSLLAVWLARRAGRRIATGVVAAEAENQRRVEELDRLFAAIRPKANQLTDASSQLARIAGDLTGAAGDTERGAGEAAEASTRVNGAIANVAQGAQELDASLRTVGGSVSDVCAVCHEAVALAEQTSGTVAHLGEAGTRIREVVKLIDRIAHQTNFLSLNASIEAAKAGAAGRGFAVVADEIEVLAQQIQASTADVASQVGGVQALVVQAVEAIARIQAIIARINQLQDSVRQAVEAQSATTGRIGASAGEAARDMAGIVATVGTVADKAAATTRGAADTNRAAGELAGMAGDLDGLTRAK